MNVLIIDNYDSFTYNIAEYAAKLGAAVTVKRNRSITINEVAELSPDAIIISPGPGRPEDAGICLDVVTAYSGKIPILGVCLGHQVIVQAFGGRIVQAPSIMHGKIDSITHDSKGLFRNIGSTFPAARYHSLIADPGTIPEVLEVTARTAGDQTIMGVRHAVHTTEGVQFHPESIGTPLGMKILENFFSYKRQVSPVFSILRKTFLGEDLDAQEAGEIMDEITNGELSPGQLGGFLGAMAVKGITAIELSAFALVLRNKTGVPRCRPNLLDTCGTGGDGKHTFNFSTASALVCSSLGVPVAKHGNKAVSSRSGSYDFLKELDIPVHQDLDHALASLDSRCFAFLFAPMYHGAMRHVAPIRQELKLRTLFNLIGPLVNPLRPDFQIAGVFDSSIMEMYAQTLSLLGVRRAMVVHSIDGMDEISVCAPTKITEVRDGTVSSYLFDPAEAGISGYEAKDILGGNPSENAAIFRAVLDGDASSQSLRAVRDGILLNAGAALAVSGYAADITEGVKLASSCIADGRARDQLAKLREHTHAQ